MVCFSTGMGKLKIKYVGQLKPHYQTREAAGADLYSANRRPVVIKPGEFKAIPTGLHIELPSGYEAQVRPRSGLAKKSGIGILNTPGTIDADYRGEIEVILFNLANKPFIVKPQMRIAQLVISRIFRPQFIKVNRLRKTKRGRGGFGHTGV